MYMSEHDLYSLFHCTSLAHVLTEILDSHK